MGNTEKQDKIISILKERTPGELVAARRKQLGWSQEELEWRSGVSVTQISKIERNIVNPIYETIEKLEDALGIPLLDQFKQYRKKHENGKQNGRSKRQAIKKFLKSAEEEMGAEAGLEEYLDQAICAMKLAKMESHEEKKLENMDSGDSEKLKDDECVYEK